MNGWMPDWKCWEGGKGRKLMRFCAVGAGRRSFAGPWPERSRLDQDDNLRFLPTAAGMTEGGMALRGGGRTRFFSGHHLLPGVGSG